MKKESCDSCSDFERGVLTKAEFHCPNCKKDYCENCVFVSGEDFGFICLECMPNLKKWQVEYI